MRITVTGARGQVAKALAEAARRREDVALELVGRPELDLERTETIAPALDRTKPDFLINAAAYTAVDAAEDEPERAFAVNVAGAEEVARFAARAGVPLIQLSTDYVFDGSQAEPYDETAATNPLNVYGRSKLEGEERVRAATDDHLIVRTSWVYSPFGRNFVKTMLDLARVRDSVRVVADQRGCPTSASDLAEVLLLMASHVNEGRSNMLGGTFHVADTGSCSWADLAEQVFADSAVAGGPTASVERIIAADFTAKAARPANSVLNCALFERSFGHRMPHWRESVEPVVRRILG